MRSGQNTNSARGPAHGRQAFRRREDRPVQQRRQKGLSARRVTEGLTSLAALSLTPHALAAVAELPVLEIVSSVHMVCDLTLGLGKVVHDYLH